jgi:hypothetical protein
MAALALALFAAPPVQAAEPKSSLELVPADAQFYLSVSRLGEHAAKIGKSNWWARVQANEALQMAWQQFTQQFVDPDSGLGPILDPENLPLAGLAGELVSDEIFVYADGRLAAMNDLYQEAAQNMFVSYAGIGYMFATGQFDFFGGGADGLENRMTDMMLGPVLERLDVFAVPHVMVGFKVKDAAKAEKILASQIERLRPLLKDAGLPGPSNEISEEQVAGAKAWLWKFDGASIPWQGMLGIDDDSPAALTSILAKLQSLKGVVALTVRNGYVLVSLGETTDRLAKLGKGPLLADSPDLAPLKKLNKPLTGVAYFSRPTIESNTYDAGDLKRLVKSIKRTMTLVGVGEATAKEVGEELDGIAKELGEAMPAPGASLTAAYTSDQGIELLHYDYGQSQYVDGSRPLAILDHVGDKPLAFFASSGKGYDEMYGKVSRSVARSYALVEKYVLPAFPPEATEQVKLVMKPILPLAKRTDRAIRDLWLPALEPGQAAIVLDARVASSQWIPGEPALPEEVAIPLPALVAAVKDTDQLHAGIKEFREIFNEGAGKFAEIAPGEIPEIRLEDPRSREFDSGTIYWHPLPKEWGLDKRLAPNYGLGSNVAAFSLVPLHTQALLTKKRPALPAPLDKPSESLAGAAHVDWPQLSKLLAPLVAYGMASEAGYQREVVEELRADGRVIRRTVFVPTVDEAAIARATSGAKEIVELLGAVGVYTSATRVEKQAVVTHGILRVVDVKPAAEPKPAE